MRPVLLIPAFITLFIPNCNAQTLAYASNSFDNEMRYSLTEYSSFQGVDKKTKHLAAAGFTCMGAGVALAFVGVVVWFSVSDFGGRGPLTQDQEARAQRTRNIGTGLLIAGGPVLITGSVLALAARRSVYHRPRKHRWGAATPAGNECGLTYNFR